MDGLLFYLIFILPKQRSLRRIIKRLETRGSTRDQSYSIFLQQHEYAITNGKMFHAATLLFSAIIQDPLHSSNRVESFASICSSKQKAWWMHKYFDLLRLFYTQLPCRIINTEHSKAKVHRVLEAISHFNRRERQGLVV